jgi:hypothetical protein
VCPERRRCEARLVDDDAGAVRRASRDDDDGPSGGVGSSTNDPAFITAQRFSRRADRKEE